MSNPPPFSNAVGQSQARSAAQPRPFHRESTRPFSCSPLHRNEQVLFSEYTDDTLLVQIKCRVCGAEWTDRIWS